MDSPEQLDAEGTSPATLDISSSARPVGIADHTADKLSASFRDPSGFVFETGGILYRQVNASYQAHYELLERSGLLAHLMDRGMLVRHEDVPTNGSSASTAYKVLRPERIPFISYPFEWAFSQLRDAALLTLEIQTEALTRGMSLKDASAYNIQFLRGKPIQIDTLSFEAYVDGAPWTAYRQFCQHYLAPLALMARRDVRLSQLFRVFIDGVPLDLASSLLPARTWLRPSLAMHLHLHARAQKRHGRQSSGTFKTARVSRHSLVALIENLKSVIAGLTWTPEGTEWADYYDDTNYTEQAAAEKRRLIASFLDHLRPARVWDLGANTGRFSHLASERGFLTMAFDLDHAAVEKNYRACVASANTHELPLVLDLTNPSSGFGWAGDERLSLDARGPADFVLALAIVHHLAISNNLPFEKIAEYLARVARHLAIEFVPKSDSQVQRLLASRVDVFDDYTRPAFESAFGRYFDMESVEGIRGTERVLYLLRRRSVPAA